MGHRILLNTRVEPQLADFLEAIKYAGETTPAVIRRVIAEYSKNMHNKEAKISDLELTYVIRDLASVAKDIQEIKKMLKILTSRSDILDSDLNSEEEPDQEFSKLDFSGYKQLKNPAY